MAKEPNVPALSPESTQFGDERYLHGAQLRALTWVGARVLCAAGGALTLWTAQGERLHELPLPEGIDRYSDLAFFPSARADRVVLGSTGTFRGVPFLLLEVCDDRVKQVAALPGNMSSDDSYYAQALDLGDTLLVGCGAWVERRSWSDGAASARVSSPLDDGSERGVTLTRDGALAAFTGYPEPQVVVMDLSSGQELQRLSPEAVHGGFGPQLAFSPDGERLYTCRSQGFRTAVEEWDPRTGARLRELDAHVGSGDVMSVQVFADCLLLRQAGVDVLCWDLSSGQLRWNQRNQALPALLASGPEGLLNAADWRVEALNPNTGAPLLEPAGLTGVATHLDYDPSSDRVVACAGKTALVFDAGGQVVDRQTAQGLHPIPGGQELLLQRRGRGHAQVELLRYRVADGEIRPLLTGAWQRVHHSGGALTLVDSYFAAAPKAARVFTPQGKELRSLGRGLPDHAAACPRALRAVSAKKTRLSVMDLATGKKTWDLKKAHKKSPERLSFSPNGALFAAASPKDLAVWDGLDDAPRLRVATDGAPRTLVWLDDGRVALVTQSGTLWVIPMEGEPLRRSVQGPVQAAHLALDGTLLISSEDGALRRYAAGDWLGLEAPEAPAAPASFPDLQAFDPRDGEALERALRDADWSAFDPQLHLLPLRSLLTQLEAHEGAGAPHHLACARLMEREDTQLKHRFGHEDSTCAFGLSPDGRWLATGSWVGADYEGGGTLQIWEVSTGRCVNILHPIEGGVGWPDYGGCAKWSPDGARVGLAYNTNSVGGFLPFEAGNAPVLDSCVTNGWSRPPAWCWGADSRDMVVFCWGGGSPIPGCVLPGGAGLVYEDDARWFAPTLPEGQDAELQPAVQGLCSPDGARIMGHNRHGDAYAVHGDSLSLAWRIKASAPAAWSPDGLRFAHSGGGLSLHDAVTGAQTHQLDLPKPRELRWCTDGRLAAVCSDGVQLLRDGVVMARIPGAPAEAPWDFPDGSAWDFSPDGRQGVLLEGDRSVSVWQLDGSAPRELARVEAPDGVGGVLFGQGVVLCIGQGLLEFRSADTLEVLAAFQPGAPRDDLLEGPSPLQKGKTDASTRYAIDPAFPMRDGESHRWVVAFPEGLVLCPEPLQPRLDQELSLVVSHRFALPFRWMNAPVFASLREAAAHPGLPLTAAEKKALVPRKKKRTPARSSRTKPLDLSPGPLTVLTDAWWAAVKGLGSGWQSHIAEYLCKQVSLLLRSGFTDAAEQAQGRIAQGHWRCVALAEGASLLAKRDPERAGRWLDQAQELLEDVVTEWNSTRVCGSLAAANHALGRHGRVQPLLDRAAERVSEEANAFQRYSALADAQWRCGQREESLATLRAGPWQAGWVPHMLTPTVQRRLEEELDAGIALLDLIVEKAGKCDEWDLFNTLVRCMLQRGRAAELPAQLSRFEGLSTDDALARAVDALRRQGDTAQAAALVQAQVQSSAEWPASQVRWAPTFIGLDREAGQALTLQLLDRGAELAKGYAPGRALGHLCEALALLGTPEHALVLTRQLDKPAMALEILRGALRAAPEHPALIEAAKATIEQLDAAPRKRAEALAQLAAHTRGDTASELWEQSIATAKRASRGDKRWATDDVVGQAVRSQQWQWAWRALFVVSKSQRQYNMMGLVDALAERGLAQAVLTLADQQGTKDLNDRPSTLWRAIERFPKGDRPLE